MKKTSLTALLAGAALFTGLSVTSAFAADGMKCGAIKCGGAIEKPAAKCGAAEKKGTMKCGPNQDGKCANTTKKGSTKCGVIKCGDALKKLNAKCGDWKCG